MRKVVVRTPETDRKLLEIPETLADLGYVPPVIYVPKYADAVTYTSSSAGTAEFGTWKLLALNSSRSLTNATLGTNRITVGTGYGGMYVITYRITWNLDVAGIFNRRVRVYVNAAPAAMQCPYGTYTPGGEHTDVATFIRRLNGNDYLTLEAVADSAVRVDLTGNCVVELLAGELEIIRVAD